MRSRGNAFQIQRSSVARSVLLVAVNECACLFLLIIQDPVADFEDEVGNVPPARLFPAGRERLHHPRDLAEVSPVSKAMSVIFESPKQFVLIKTGISGPMSSGQSQEHLPWEVILVSIPTFSGNAVRGDPPVHINT